MKTCVWVYGLPMTVAASVCKKTASGIIIRENKRERERETFSGKIFV